MTPFGERDLVQAACAFRLLSPEAELSLSTRESEAFRNRAFRLGFTSMSAGSRTNPGGYASAPDSLEQFEIDDSRSPAEVAAFLRSQGYEPVWKDWDSTYDGFGGHRRARPAARGRGLVRGRPAAMPLSPEEIDRYQRHLSLPGFGPAAQERLKAGSVLVIGAGGLGCPALLYLAAAGVGRIVGRRPRRGRRRRTSSARCSTRRPTGDRTRRRPPRAGCAALNPLVRVEPHPVRFGRSNALELVRSCDVVVDGSDNFATRYLVNDACVIAGRPFVYGAIQGFEGHVSVFNWRGGPTYRCLFPEPPEPGTVPNCAEAGRPWRRDRGRSGQRRPARRSRSSPGSASRSPAASSSGTPWT